VNGTAGHILWALAGALVGGLIGLVLVPAFFWAALLAGAMLGAAVRVGYVILTAEDQS
jgi:hypothetical protein